MQVSDPLPQLTAGAQYRYMFWLLFYFKLGEQLGIIQPYSQDTMYKTYMVCTLPTNILVNFLNCADDIAFLSEPKCRNSSFNAWIYEETKLSEIVLRDAGTATYI